jgi:hypothetical protein
LNLIDSISKSEFEIIFKDINWKNHLENSYRIAEISKEAIEVKNIELATDQGTPVIEVCINAENDGEDTKFK